mmetsp:Transcript_9803/g.24987  ORF Transcript_9803/g.24987 Transcript_9803/m.24987 type:complete len:234 (-) Transcript_9803:205-906(-)
MAGNTERVATGLEALLDDVLAEQQKALSTDQREVGVEARADAALSAFKGELMSGLRHRLLEAEQGNATVDEEVEALHQQVLETAGRLSIYRQAMPLRVQEQLAVTLQRLRPPTTPGPEVANEDTDPAGAEADKENAPVAGFSPGPDDLCERLQGAAAKAPSLRAKLKECLDRMERVTAAVSSVQGHPTPGTVERVLIGTPADGAHTPAATATPGDMLTRKRLLADLKPVPYDA